jgi:hypothetical protein
MQPIAEVTGYSSLHVTIRARLASLGLARWQIGELAGVPDGYAAKVLAPYPVRKIGIDLWVAFLRAAGLKMVLVEDETQAARIAAIRVNPRAILNSVQHPHQELLEPRALLEKVLREQLRKHASRAGKLSAAGRMRKIPPWKRRAIAKRAARARWRQRRERSV